MSEADSYSKKILGLSVETGMIPAATVSRVEVVSTVINLMIRESAGSVVVLENNKPVGIVTERDILERVIQAGKNPELTVVNDIMSSNPLVTIEVDRTVGDALELMHKHNIRKVVVTREGALAGLSTERRLLEIVHSHYMLQAILPAKPVDDYEVHKIRIAYVSTYPPRECGIATYTKHLVDATSTFCARVVTSPVVVAINERGGIYDYEPRVKSQIEADVFDCYEKVARYINASNVDVVNLQHEYGIFGGEWGEYVTGFLKNLQKPVVTTLHTVLEKPAPQAKRVLGEVLEHSDFAIVMAKVGIEILERSYGGSVGRIWHIPHGCPNVPYVETAMTKQNLGLQDKPVISTFGLLGRGKGIEYAIEALPMVVKEHPQALYLVIGETHPEIRKHEGEEYRQFLLNRVESLGLENNVRFVNRFLDENELINYLHATDVYVVPYPNREQISSGTLTYALGTGKAIVTTPFLQAEEVISRGAAMRCSFEDPASITESVNVLLNDDRVRERFGRMAYEYSRSMIWPNVAMSYVNVFYHALGL
jgi:polysaccharide biosynthesis protein PslF